MAGEIFGVNVGPVIVGVAVTLRAMAVAVVRMRNVRHIFPTVRIADETGERGRHGLHR